MQGHYKSCPDPSDCWCQVRRVSKLLWIVFAIIAVQITAGTLSGSLALFADAGHTAVDSIAYSMLLVVAILIRLKASSSRVDTVAFSINIGLLFLTVIWILFEAYKRFYEPREVGSVIMIMGAGIAMVLNFMQHKILEGTADAHKKEALKTHKSTSAHIIQDMVISGGVVISGIGIFLTGWKIIDPITSIVIACFIFYLTIRLVREKDIAL